MKSLATITTKKQLTIPVKIFTSAGLKERQKVLLTFENGTIKIEPALNLVSRLAGSVIVPQRFKDWPLQKIITKARKERFSKR